MYYNVNGVPSQEPNDNFYIEEIDNDFTFPKKDIVLNIEHNCILLYEYLKDMIFLDKNIYYSLQKKTGIFFPFAGLESDIKISKNEFESIINLIENNKDLECKKLLFKLLYYYDFSKLISTLQNSVIESLFLFCNFYKLLNTKNYLVTDIEVLKKTNFNNKILYAGGFFVTDIVSNINHIFINLHSQLDFLTKILFEFQNICTKYESYPRLTSKTILFNYGKNIKIIPLENTIFERHERILMIESFRNEIIHNASFDNYPKVYVKIQEWKIIEKFILIPDLNDGILTSYKNRNRFYSEDKKLNLILPSIMQNFWNKLNYTLDILIKKLDKKSL
jgi:hypothetical protein